MSYANRYFRDLSGQIIRIRRTPTAEGVALGIESDEIAYRHDAVNAKIIGRFSPFLMSAIGH